MFRYRKCIPDDCIKHETNSRILHVFLISLSIITLYIYHIYHIYIPYNYYEGTPFTVRFLAPPKIAHIVPQITPYL